MGDDQISGWEKDIDFSHVIDNAKKEHNMVLEVATSHNVGGFLRMVGTLHDGIIHFGPDFIRMRYKYEVTNGVSSVD